MRSALTRDLPRDCLEKRRTKRSSSGSDAPAGYATMMMMRQGRREEFVEQMSFSLEYSGEGVREDDSGGIEDDELGACVIRGRRKRLAM